MNGFEFYLQKLNRHPHTIQAHLKLLKVLLRTLPVWSVEAVDNFVVSLRNKGYATATINGYIGTIRLYSKHMGYCKELQNYKMWKKEYKLKGTLSDEEIEAIYTMEKPDNHRDKPWRDFSIFAKVLSLSGMRPGELGSLKVENVDLGRNIMMIQHTKTGIPRQVPIPSNCVEEMKQLVDKAKDYLFVTERGYPYSDHSWGHAFEFRVKRLGIKRPNISIYSLRHSYITRQLELDTNIHKIAKLVGHSVEQTATYEHLTVKDIQDVVKKHPLVRKNSSVNPQELIEEITTILKTYDLGYTTTKGDDSVTLTILTR